MRFSEYMAHFGVDRLILYDVRGASPKIRTNMGHDWVAHYMAQGYARIDPFYEHCMTPGRSMPTGAAHLAALRHLDPRQQRLIEEAGEAGFHSGFSLMLPGQPGVAWNIGSGLQPEALARLRLALGESLPLALRLLQMRLDAPPPLTAREAEVLEWLAEGLRTKEIAHRMAITPVTVELHLRSARTKLGARTRDQALLQAVLRGMVRPYGRPGRG
ncbi:helix-turn-helix transcriptional regulator [Roseococcus suduntuyensis]|nr:LuxR C-terminal-related transcriptional regulator [Roseococcus suduntuyensis]